MKNRNGQCHPVGGDYIRRLDVELVLVLLLLGSFCEGLSGASFVATGGLAPSRNSHTATLLPNGRVLVAGGYHSGSPFYLSSVELYDPATGIWAVTASLGTARVDHTATLLPNGKVLVVGGQGGSGALTNAELYD